MEHLSAECQAAGYSTVDCEGIGGTAIFPGFGEINLKNLTPERCGELVQGGFKWIVKEGTAPELTEEEAAAVETEKEAAAAETEKEAAAVETEKEAAAAETEKEAAAVETSKKGKK